MQQAVRKQVLELWASGTPMRKIREATGLDDVAIRKILTAASAKPTRKGGRPPMTS